MLVPVGAMALVKKWRKFSVEDGLYCCRVVQWYYALVRDRVVFLCFRFERRFIRSLEVNINISIYLLPK
jgi:hypothetical protein